MDTLVILGVDAADYELAKKWKCENLLLAHNGSLKTENHSLDVPATLEVWPTIATGLAPEDHGIVLNNTGWDSRRGLMTIVKIANLFPEPVTNRLRLAKEVFIDENKGKQYTNAPHIFDEGRVINWPGVTPCHLWTEEGEWFTQLDNGEISAEEFYIRSLGNTGRIIGWLASMDQMDIPIIGAHIHTLDHMGHIYAKRPEKLRESYTQVDNLIGILRENVERLVIISDHGMQTMEIESDSEYGVHSFRAMVSSSFTDDLPHSITSVKPWIEKHVSIQTHSAANSSTAIDASKEHLRDLGYL